MSKGAAEKQGLARVYGGVIMVRNLDRSRAFYSTVLRLGKPVVSTNLWVEFEVIPGQTVLALQQSNSVRETPDLDKGDVRCCFAVPDLEEFRRHLREHGVHPAPIQKLAVGKEFFTFRDPEGNPLMAVTGSE